MSTQPDLVRKVRQLDNDVQAIYDMLRTISKTQHDHGNRLDEISQSQSNMSAIQLRHNNRFEEFGADLDKLAVTQLRQGNRLDEIAARQDQQDAKLDTILELLRRPNSE